MRLSTLLLSSALFGLSLTAQAQITITQADMPVPADTLRVSQGVADSLLNYAQTGPNQTWNFANLIPVAQRVNGFVTVNSTGGIFPLIFGPFGGNNSANVAALVQLPLDSLPGGGGIQLGDIYGFFKKQAADYRQVGYGATLSGAPVPVTYQQGQQDVVYRFPLTFGAQDSSYSAFEVNVPNTVYLGQNQNRRNHCDGWGTLTTPFGTFATVRVNTTLDTYDSLAFNGQAPLALQLPTRHEYKWLANGHHIPLLTISTAEVAGQEIVTGVEWRDIYRHIQFPTGLPTTQPLAGLTLSPNPATTYQSLTLHGLPAAEPATVTVVDALGRLVGQAVVRGPEALLPAAVLGTARGVLTVRVTTATSTTTQRLVRE